MIKLLTALTWATFGGLSFEAHVLRIDLVRAWGEQSGVEVL